MDEKPKKERTTVATIKSTERFQFKWYTLTKGIITQNVSSFDQEVLIIKPTVKEKRNPPTSPERRVCPWNPSHHPSASNQQPVSQPASQSASMDR